MTTVLSKKMNFRAEVEPEKFPRGLNGMSTDERNGTFKHAYLSVTSTKTPVLKLPDNEVLGLVQRKHCILFGGFEYKVTVQGNNSMLAELPMKSS